MGIKNVSPLHPLSDFRTATVLCAHPNQKGEQWLRLWCKTKGQLVYDERVSCRHFPGSPVVKTLPSNTWCVGSIPGQGAKILHALWLKNEKMKQKQYCIKFNKGSKKKKWERAVIMKVHVKNWESTMKTNVSFLLRHYDYFFHWYEKVQINTSFIRFLQSLCIFHFTIIKKERTIVVSCVHYSKQCSFTLAVH